MLSVGTPEGPSGQPLGRNDRRGAGVHSLFGFLDKIDRAGNEASSIEKTRRQPRLGFVQSKSF